jgi:hypothetical protein
MRRESSGHPRFQSGKMAMQHLVEGQRVAGWGPYTKRGRRHRRTRIESRRYTGIHRSVASILTQASTHEVKSFSSC